MGTQPIFESDFDCLTDFEKNNINMVASEFDYVLQNMQKELESQVEKVNKTTKERDAIGKRIGQFEAQLSETKVVLSELELVGDDATVYKLLGPVLVKQEKEIALQTINNRKDFMENELKKSESQIEKIAKTLAKEQEALRELHMKSQQFKQALA